MAVYADNYGLKAITFLYTGIITLTPHIRQVLNGTAAPGPTGFGSVAAAPQFQVLFLFLSAALRANEGECIDRGGEIQASRGSTLRHDRPVYRCREGAGRRDKC